MSDILIRGMEMPETGVYILSVDKTDADATIFTVSEQTNSGKIIPKHVGKAVTLQPHGALKDVDALRSNMYDSLTKQFYINQKQIEDAPTIIPAEGGASDG